MKRTLKKVFMPLMALMLMCVQSAQAQVKFTGSVTQYPDNNYTYVNVFFSMSEIAAALNADTAALVSDLDAWAATWDMNNLPATNYFKLRDPNTGEAVEKYNQGNVAGYNLNNKGEIATWGASTNGATWFIIPAWDKDNDQIYFWLAQHPDSMDKPNGVDAHCEYVLQYNGREVSLEINYNIKPFEKIDTMAAHINESDLDIVAEKTLNVVQQYRKNTNRDTYTVDVKDVLDKFDEVDLTALNQNMKHVMYTYMYDPDTDSKTSYISKESTATAPGWWMYPLFGDDGETPTGELVGGTYASETMFYFDTFTISEDSVLTVGVGQNSGVAQAETPYNGTVYMVYKGKAMKLNINVELTPLTELPLDEMEIVGDTTFVIVREAKQGWTDPTGNGVDFEQIASLLGVEQSSILFKGLGSDDNTLVDSPLTWDKGFWFNSEGRVASSGVFYAVPYNQVDYSYLYVGSDANNPVTSTTHIIAPVFYVAGDKYYRLNLDVTLTVPQIEVGVDDFVDTGLHIKDQVEIVPTTSESSEWHSTGMTTYIDLDYVNSVIGTSAANPPFLFGYEAPTEEGAEPAISQRYTATPNPGFWIGSDGKYISGYNSECTYAMTVDTSTGEVTWYQVPGARKAGETYESTLVLVNGLTGKYMKYITEVYVVASYTEKEVLKTAGSESLIAELNGEDPTYTALNIGKACTALGVTAEEFEAVTFSARNVDGQLVSGEYYDEASGGFLYGSNGLALDPAVALEGTDGKFYMNITFDNGQPELAACLTAGTPALEDGESYTAQIAAEYSGKRYVYNVTLYNHAKYTGIEAVNEAEDAAPSVVVDVTGRVVAKDLTGLKELPAGIYIYKNKKYYVK